ncbi:hypothetical protein ACFLTM_03485 [Candidatus Bipolaricaulota bacterium]
MPFFAVGDFIRKHFEGFGTDAKLRQYAVLRLRNGLDSSPQVTLRETGIILDVSKQRAGQLEEKAVKTLSKLLRGETSHSDSRCDTEFESVRGRIEEILDPSILPLLEDQVVKSLGRSFSLVEADLSLVRVIMRALGFDREILMPGTKHETAVWTGSGKGARILEATERVFKALQGLVVPASFEMIKLRVNSERGAGSRFGDAELRSGLRLCPSIEVAGGQAYQLAFDCLRNIQDRAHRVLYEEGEPLRAREIARLVTKRCYETGSELIANTQSLGNALSADGRFALQGRTLWALEEWDVDTRTVVGLMEAALHTSGEPLAAAEIWEFVKEKRSASRNSIGLYLKDRRFAKTRDGKHALREWGVKGTSGKSSAPREPPEAIRSRVSRRELIQNTTRSLLRRAEGLTLPLKDLRDSVVRDLDCPKASVYGAISQMADIEKAPNAGGVVVCTLVDATRPFKEKVDAVPQEHLRSELRRALGLLHIDTADLALFQLGKLFEQTLRGYMEAIDASGSAVVTQQDRSKLARMVSWAGREGLIRDETALHFLRIKRNERAHGEIPSLREREALLANSGAIVPFYLDYVLLLSQRLAELEA